MAKKILILNGAARKNGSTVTVTGAIAPGERCDPELLAEDFWTLYTQRRDCELVH